MIEKVNSKHTKKFVPDDFKIPVLLETDLFCLRMLFVDDIEKDYEAVIFLEFIYLFIYEYLDLDKVFQNKEF